MHYKKVHAGYISNIPAEDNAFNSLLKASKTTLKTPQGTFNNLNLVVADTMSGHKVNDVDTPCGV